MMGQKIKKLFNIFLFMSFVALPTDRQTDKIVVDYMLLDQMNLHEKNQTFIVNSTR